MRIKFHNDTWAHAKPVRFAIDGGYDNTGFDGFYIEGRRWNGWLQPYVTRETYLQIIAELITPIIDSDPSDIFMAQERESMLEWFADDGLVNGYPSADDEPDTLNGLYFVGWGYCWDTQSERPQEPTDYELHRQTMDAKA